jgi:hypothetical protein
LVLLDFLTLVIRPHIASSGFMLNRPVAIAVAIFRPDY